MKSGFTAAEVSAHNSPTDCWYIYGTKVVDITQYIASGQHPGVPKRLLRAQACCAVPAGFAGCCRSRSATLSAATGIGLAIQLLVCHQCCSLCLHPCRAPRHADGNPVMYPCCGRDCTSDFDASHRGSRALREQATFYIGDFIS